MVLVFVINIGDLPSVDCSIQFNILRAPQIRFLIVKTNKMELKYLLVSCLIEGNVVLTIIYPNEVLSI